jgi:hypothetical protein
MARCDLRYRLWWHDRQNQKPGIEDPSTIGFLLSLLRNDLCNKWYLPQLEGHLLVGSKFQYLELVKLDGAKVIGRQKIATDIGRVRNVARAGRFHLSGVEGREF